VEALLCRRLNLAIEPDDLPSPVVAWLKIFFLNNKVWGNDIDLVRTCRTTEAAVIAPG
jgi:hypothetical protein